MKQEMPRQVDTVIRLVLIGILVGMAYYTGAIVGFALTLPTHSVSTLWPPNAILLATLLLVPSRQWWVVLLGAFPAHLIIQLQSSVPLLMSLCWFVSNSSEALIGAFFLRRFSKGPIDFASVKSIIFYVGFAAILAPFLSSFLDAAFVLLVGSQEHSYWRVWFTRFPSNVLAAIAIPPVIVLVASKARLWAATASWRRYAEAFLLNGALIAVSYLVFGWQAAGSETTPALLYLPLPFLLWAAMRFGSGGASIALLIVVLESLYGAAKGRGPFVNSSPEENVFAAQMFLLAISLPVMFLAGLVEEQREEAKMLSESEARFRSMANTAPVLIWISGVDKLYTFFNKAWLDFTGRTLAQELGAGWTQGLHREDFDRCIETYGNAFNAREEFSLEYRLRRYDGEYGWVLNNGVPRFESDGTFLGYIGSAIDITQRKETESELRRQRAELAHMTRISTMGELAASLAHELNQPLTAILSNAQAAQRFLAARPTELEEVREILKDIVQDDSRAGDVIWRMRALLKKEKLDFLSLDLSALVKDVVVLLHSDAVLHNIRIALKLGTDLPPVRGEKVQLQQVVLNLLLNAFDAMTEVPANEREVQVRAETDGAGMLRVAVGDRGIGLSAEKLDKIFQPFYTTKREGIGMGLSISRSIVEAHGGYLWAENNSDVGATFYFTVPIYREDLTENSSFQFVRPGAG
jgi:two-component system sensor kinase FixL